MTNCIGVIYVKNNIVLLWLVRLGVVYDENQTRKHRDQLYKCGLCRNQDWNVGTYLIECNLWRKQDKKTDVTKHISLVYPETETKLSGLIWLGLIYDETRQDNDLTDHTDKIFSENEIELFWQIGPHVFCEEKPNKITTWPII